jgi:hypothetical protein
MNKVNLNFPQLYSLYSNGMRIDKSVVQEILELPKEPLIADLETILKASIDHFSFYKSKNLAELKRCFPVHAFFLLTELKATSSLYTVLAFLSQPKEFLHFWCGNYSKELIWETVYTLGNNETDFLQKFFLSQVNTAETNRVIVKAISQIALHQPERRNEIIRWYRGVISHLLNTTYQDFHYPFELAGTVVSGILDFKGIELINDVRILYDRNKVNKSICGDINDFTTELRTEKISDFKSKVYNIFERYDFLLKSREYYIKMYDEKDSDRYLRRNLIKN